MGGYWIEEGYFCFSGDFLGKGFWDLGVVCGVFDRGIGVGKFFLYDISDWSGRGSGSVWNMGEVLVFKYSFFGIVRGGYFEYLFFYFGSKF